jgi:hypothetical protein
MNINTIYIPYITIWNKSLIELGLKLYILVNFLRTQILTLLFHRSSLERFSSSNFSYTTRKHETSFGINNLHSWRLFIWPNYSKKKKLKNILLSVCVCVCVYSSPGIFILRHVQERGKKESVKEHRVRKGQA